jgi:predicted permease
VTPTRWWSMLRARLRAVTRRRRDAAQLAADLEFHLDSYADEQVRAGVSPREAKRRARAAFGSRMSVLESHRDFARVPIVESIWRDLRQAARGLRRSPGVAATAVLTLALCLGATLAVFAIVDAVLVKPLPFPDPDCLVTMFNSYPRAGVARDESSITNYYERRGQISAFSHLSIYREWPSTTGDASATDREPVMHISPDFFATLGVALATGRPFVDQETLPGADRVVIVSDRVWRDRFDADPHILGRTIRIDRMPRTIVGVLAPTFRFLSSQAQLYVPLASDLSRRVPAERHSGSAATMIARLAPGVSLEDAQSQVDARNAAVELIAPYGQAHQMNEAGFRTLVRPLRADHVSSVRPVLLLLQTGAGLLLVIGVVNLINLLLVRSSARLKEFATRRALGASGRQLVGHVVAEMLLLSICGGAVGTALGMTGVRLLALAGADRLPLGASLAFDARTVALGFAAALAIGAAMAGTVSAFLLRDRSGRALHDTSRGHTSGQEAQRLREVFVVLQVALSFVLLVAASLLGASLNRALAVDPGFRVDHVLTGRVSLAGTTNGSAAGTLAFIGRLTGDLSNRPGVDAVGITTKLPLTGDTKSAVTVKGYVLPAGESVRGTYTYGIGGDYFKAMHIDLREGRTLTAEDSRDRLRVCVVDDDFARHYWPGRHAIDQTLFNSSRAQADDLAFRVVGVVAPVRQRGITADERQGAVYFPFSYGGDNTFFVVARTNVAPRSFVTTFRRAVRAIDPEVPMSDIETMDARVADDLFLRRSPALLAIAFSVVALVLAAVGTYGVVSAAVARQRREVGIRMALGAAPAQIRQQFLWFGLRLVGIGALVGGAGAQLSGVALRNLLFGVTALDPDALAAAAVLMALVTTTACAVPAVHAARIPPTQVLAEE